MFKRHIAILTTLVLLLGLFAGAFTLSSAAEALLYGDVNGDGVVDSSDARLILQAEVGLMELDDDQKQRGDVNGDGVLDSTVARMILQYYVELLDSLGPEEPPKPPEPPEQKEDFVLTISVEETTLPQGENFVVNVELKNNSGENQVIFYDYLFIPAIQDWSIFTERKDIPGAPIVMHNRSTMFEADSVLRNIETWGFESGPRSFGATLEPGTHELRFYATFSLNWGQKDRQLINVLSNIIILTVQ